MAYQFGIRVSFNFGIKRESTARFVALELISRLKVFAQYSAERRGGVRMRGCVKAAYRKLTEKGTSIGFYARFLEYIRKVEKVHFVPRKRIV